MLRLVAHHGPVEPGFGLMQPLSRDSVGGRAVIDREPIHVEDLMAVAATEFPEAVSAVERMGGRHDTRRAVTTRGNCERGDFYSSDRGSAIFRQADRTPENICLSGRYRHRECSPLQRTARAQCRIARGAGTSDGDIRSAWYYQPLADGRAAGPGRYRGECCTGLWNR